MPFRTVKKPKSLKEVGKRKVKLNPDTLSSHRFKMRGMNRKTLGQVPKKHQTNIATPQLTKSFGELVNTMSITDKLIDVAKKAKVGIWRVSKPQVLDIARKYKFHVPGKEKPMRHLGSTGIQLIRYKPGVYYMYKPKRGPKKKRKSPRGSGAATGLAAMNMGMGS